ncbi:MULTISPECIES: hypothetical protein [Streptomyces]|jgi:hypothetical protein|uniref:hypothetical protein n=1 Tax=Streptomyces TaxID=1883 RepID=UPI0004C288FD|nr:MULTISPECIES: hypothetical protein [Streptomyces]WSQ21782.1 hypothetical protein OG237_32305 [Streptomyces zaomyceticus]
MRSLTTAALAATLLLGLTACGTADNPPSTPSDKGGVEASTAPPSAKAPARTVSPEDLAKAREAAGLPPEPTAKARQAYLGALNAIDPRIIKPGKEDQAVSRGSNQCRSIKDSKDDAKLAQTALERFTVDTRLPEIATPETGRKINEAVHTHLCPNF